MRRAALLLLVLALPAPALAAEVARSFVFQHGGETPGLAARVQAQLPEWLSSVRTELEAGDTWDEKRDGPFTLVRKRLRTQLEPRGDGIVRVRVALDDQGLRSGAASVEAAGRRLIAHLEAKVRTEAAAERKRQSARVQATVTAARTRVAATEKRLADVEAEWGDPVAERVSSRERIRRVRSAYTDAKIDAAVTARQLARAKTAAARAVEVERLERATASVREDLERAGKEPDPALRAKLDRLEETLLSARAKSPSLETARERVFDLEVEATAAAARSELLAAELAELRKLAAELLTVEREYRDLLRDRELRRSREREALLRLESLLPQLDQPVFELLGRLAPDPATPR